MYVVENEQPGYVSYIYNLCPSTLLHPLTIKAMSQHNYIDYPQVENLW